MASRSVKVLGNNPLGVVYGAIYQKSRVAVKKMLRDALDEYESVTNILKLDHENVVKIFKVDDLLVNNCFFRCFVLELCTGTLDDYFHGRYEELPRDKMPGDLDALSQMAQGLSYMHSKNLFHGAIKPANVSVTLRSSIIPQVVLKVSQDSLMTWSKGSVPHNLIGIDSYIYWPPEWLEILEYEEYQVPEPAAAADIFALGCLFYGYITKGGHPFGKGVLTLSNILNSKHDLSEIKKHSAFNLVLCMIQTRATLRPPMTGVLEKLTVMAARKSVADLVTKSTYLNESQKHSQYLMEYRVNRCEDFLTDKGCSSNNCFNYHHPNQRRRRSFRMKDGTLNYSCTYQCLLYDITTGECSRGDGCPLLHVNAGNSERCYHLSVYKTELCNKADCNNPHCAFAHGKSDMRAPIFSRGDPRVLSKDNDAMPASVVMKSHSLWQNPEYVVDNYKTKPCATSYEQCTLKANCPYYHTWQERRRSLKKFKYGSQACPHVFDKRGVWKEPSLCRDGDACRYCHSKKEYMYHTLNYKTVKCTSLKSGSCKRGQFCVFTHDNEKWTMKSKQLQLGDESTMKNLKSFLQLI